MFEDHAGGGELVKVRCQYVLRPGEAGVSVAHVVVHEGDDVGFRRCLCVQECGEFADGASERPLEGGVQLTAAVESAGVGQVTEGEAFTRFDLGTLKNGERAKSPAPPDSTKNLC